MKAQRLGKNRLKRGVTLVELLFALGIFGLLSAGLILSVYYSQNLANQNIVRSTVETAMIGYQEQIRSIAYSSLLQAYDNPQSTPIPTKSLSVIAAQEGGAVELDDPLYLDISNEKEIVLDVDRNDNGQITDLKTVTLWVTPQLQTLSADEFGYEAFEVTLDYSWETRSGTENIVGNSTKRFVYVNVP